MDAVRFDALAKVFSSIGSRRQAVSGLVGALLGVRAIAPARADNGKPAKSKGNHRRNDSSRPRTTASRKPHGHKHRQQRAGKKRENHNHHHRPREGTTRARAAAAGLPEIDYFALGDSIASGHGLNDNGNGNGQACAPTGSPPCCRRSTKSYPSKVRDLLAEDYQVHFHHLACSGATARDSLPSQMDEALGIIEQRNETPAYRGRPTLVSITIGANDLEWADLLKLAERLIFKTDAQYVEFVDKRVEVTAKIITLVIKRLLAIDGVRVVLTDVHNPFNDEPGPLFVRLARQFWSRDPRILPFGPALRCSVLECLPGLPCGAMDCAERAELAATRLGNALSGVLFRLNEAEQSRVQFAHAAFAAGHNEAPRKICGAATPDKDETWIQYPGDPNSNSLPRWEIKVDSDMKTIVWGGGDCFHPNEKGATAYADAVHADAVRLGFDGAPQCEQACLPGSHCVNRECVTNESYEFVTAWGSQGTSNGQFEAPFGIDVDSAGNVYVTEAGFANRVQKFDSNGTFLTKWGTSGSGVGEFGNIRDIAVDSAGNVYVTDQAYPRIHIFDSNGRFLNEWDFYTDVGPQYYPLSIAVDHSGSVYVTVTAITFDEGILQGVRKLDSTGGLLAEWGSEGSGVGEFGNIHDIAVDSAGDVYVTDVGGPNRVQKFDSNGGFLTKWGGPGTANGQFGDPTGVAVDSVGNVYVADRGQGHGSEGKSRVQKFDSNGTFLTKWGTSGSGEGQFILPEGVAVDSAGNVYVADLLNYRIQKFAPVGTSQLTAKRQDSSAQGPEAQNQHTSKDRKRRRQHDRR